jgi:REP element-mobilizing transposase RayT
MARLARIVVPGRAHHVTQRGNRREAIFFEEGDQAIYLDLSSRQNSIRAQNGVNDELCVQIRDEVRLEKA